MILELKSQIVINPRREEKEHETEAKLEEIIAKNFPKLKRDTRGQILEA